MLVLLTLAAGQFLMTLDSSVMNVSIATVAEDVGTTVTGIQGAITAYTLVMAALMLTGAKIGAIIGRKRAFAIGCVIYGCGSFTTSICSRSGKSRAIAASQMRMASSCFATGRVSIQPGCWLPQNSTCHLKVWPLARAWS